MLVPLGWFSLANYDSAAYTAPVSGGMWVPC
jgi:hypothetical protein